MTEPLVLIEIYVPDGFVIKEMPITSGNRMAWQWAETLVEIKETLADIRGTTK